MLVGTMQAKKSNHINIALLHKVSRGHGWQYKRQRNLSGTDSPAKKYEVTQY